MQKLLVTTIATAISASPAMSAPPAPRVSGANPARSLSVGAATRAGTPTQKRSRIAAPGGAISLVLGAAVLVGAVVLITNNEDEGDSPDSN